MKVDFKKDNKFTLIEIEDGRLSTEDSKFLANQILNQFKEKKQNFLLDLLGKTTDSSLAKEFDNLNISISRKGFSFVIATDDEKLKNGLSNYFISHAPTKSEATDLLFMEELEKELMDDNFDEEE